MTEDRMASQKQEFDRQVNEIRSDQGEDRKLAAERYARLILLERFADRVVVFYRDVGHAFGRVDQVFGRLVALIPEATLVENGIVGTTLAENGIVMPEPPTLPSHE
jgi:hypothetical protein